MAHGVYAGLKRSGEQAVRRRGLRVWCAVGWGTRAWEGCKGVVVPGQGGGAV